MLRRYVASPLLRAATWRSLASRSSAARLAAAAGSKAGFDDEGSSGHGGGRQSSKLAPKDRKPEHPERKQAPFAWDDHVNWLKKQSAVAFREDAAGASSKPYMDWRNDPNHKVAYRYRLPQFESQKKAKAAKEAAPATEHNVEEKKVKEQKAYTEVSGLRFPTLETAENYDYYKDRGLDRVVFERVYPIKVPGYRRLDPYLREYIHFLHNLDPARFTIERIAERYRMRPKTVAIVVQEWGVNKYLRQSGLIRKTGDKQRTQEELILRRKEGMYSKWVGWDQLGDAEDAESSDEDENLGKFQGWRSTSDWVRRQTVEVEMMRAFPMSEKRDPMPKRVDVDLVVDNSRDFKVINWIDPSDKVVF